MDAPLVMRSTVPQCGSAIVQKLTTGEVCPLDEHRPYAEQGGLAQPRGTGSIGSGAIARC